MNNQSSDVLSVTRATDSAARAAVSTRALTLLAADLAAFAIATVLALAVVFAAEAPAGFSSDGTQQWHGWGTLAVLMALLAVLAARGRYTTRTPFRVELASVAGGVAVAFLTDSFIRSDLYSAPPGLEEMLRWVLFVPCLLVLREAARAGLQARGLWGMKTLIVGDGEAVAGARAALSSDPGLGYDVVGAMSLQRAMSHRLAAGGIEALRSFGAEFVVVAMSGGNPAAENAVAAGLARARVPFAMVPALDGVPVTGVDKHYFLAHDVLMLTCHNNLARPLCRLVKGLFDQAAAAVALLLLSPLFLVLCALIRMDGGPSFFRHARIGEGGQRFRCIKFRTMTVHADAVLRELLAHDPEARLEWAATQKLRADPRTTRIGRVLRKTSLDELPQLLNVLRGEMSLVGPRPIVDAEVMRYGDKIAFYYEAKPGITGLWQVSGRSNTSYQHRVQLDVWYVRNWTLWQDIAILMKTIPAVLLKEGAV